MAAFRYAFQRLRYKETVKILFKDVMPVIGERPGGYTRILKIGKRLSDSTPMCYIELVDFNTTYKVKEDNKKKRTRRSKTTKKTSEQTPENKEQQNTNSEE
jgi:large subunit ribosomal protein L17